MKLTWGEGRNVHVAAQIAIEIIVVAVVVVAVVVFVAVVCLFVFTSDHQTF